MGKVEVKLSHIIRGWARWDWGKVAFWGLGGGGGLDIWVMLIDSVESVVGIGLGLVWTEVVDELLDDV